MTLAQHRCRQRVQHHHIRPLTGIQTADLRLQPDGTRVAQGGEIFERFFWQPFFYPYFLTCVYKLTGCSIIAAKIIQPIIGALTCILCFRLGLIVFPPSSVPFFVIWCKCLCVCLLI